ncbi:hypothetical protein BDB00DRAFT_932829 [Zychaea mexicana]|uniref:uncharacterized protein n=1 Tax=Zychaea mexicana TaxID=64656 RepID=UPI0022FF405F|nr:uncharacterized protein BDB00DRAFT_932829 [Zychaea mexicana]KAI9488334.1 hypothetical protein BDB00DRAFT_932829 [Zychaea mexicana]
MSSVQCCICLESYKTSKTTTTTSCSVASSSKSPVVSRPPPQRSAAASSSSSQRKKHDGNVFSTKGCAHHACRPCLAQYFLAYVQKSRIEDDYSALDCPEPGCDETYVAIEIIPQVMPNAETALYWWRIVIEKTIMDSIGYCPYPDCQASFELPDYHQQQHWQQQSAAPIASSSTYTGTTVMAPHVDEDEERPIFAECLECNRGICLNCQSIWHSDKQCKPEAERTATPPWRDSKAYRRAHTQKGKELKRKLSVEARNLARKRNWTRCPRCQEMVERVSGCSTILCSCGIEFCYRCGSPSSGHVCSRRCNMLSGAQLNSVRSTMFTYN